MISGVVRFLPDAPDCRWIDLRLLSGGIERRDDVIGTKEELFDNNGAFSLRLRTDERAGGPRRYVDAPSSCSRLPQTFIRHLGGVRLRSHRGAVRIVVSGESPFERARSAADFLGAWLSRPYLSPANQAFLDNYYQKFRGLRSPRLFYWYNEQLVDAEALVRGAGNVRVLEVGTGTGTECLWWAMLGADVVGIDPFPHCISVVQERLSVLRANVSRSLRCELHVASVADFRDPHGFDVVWLEQSFHHLEPRAEVVASLGRLVRPGGHIVISEANALNPLLQLQLLRLRGFRTIARSDRQGGPKIWGDERVLWRGALARHMRSVGIEQISARYYRVFPSHPVFEPLFPIELHLSKRWLAPLCTHYNYVGQKI